MHTRYNTFSIYRLVARAEFRARVASQTTKNITISRVSAYIFPCVCSYIVYYEGCSAYKMSYHFVCMRKLKNF